MKKLKLWIFSKKSYKNDHELELPNFFSFVKRNARSIQEKYLKNCHFLFWGIKMASNMKNDLKINLKNNF